MKKILFGLIATVLFSGMSVGQVKTPPVTGAQKIHIEIGRVSKQCGGFGLCVFTIDITWEDIATLFGINNRGRIGLIMSSEYYNQHKDKFAGGYFTIEEDFKVDLNTSRALSVTDNYVIKTGKYPIVFDKDKNTYNCTF